MHPSAPLSSAPNPRRGFALLITITLLAFLVLLLVSLASLTRVETQVASNTQQLSQCRQNALTALNIALGELQKYAGPDQRATARADIEATSTTNGSRHWTGVWGNANNPQSDVSSAPVPLQWLVSGNEETDFDPATQVSFAEASFGQISDAATTAASRVYTPAQAINGLTPTATVDTAITINNRDAALLVGPGSADDVNNYVVAPLRNIEVPPSNIPGMGSSGSPVRVGRYAWWVGDEGVKARVNLVDPYVLPSPGMTAAADTASPFRLMAPQRFAVERVTGFGSFPVNTAAARNILRPEQVTLAESSLTPAVRQTRFHDLTTTSTGVLADSLRGGLKRDLTFAFAQSEANFRTALALPSGSANPIVPVAIMPAAEQGPTWEQLRSFARLDGSSVIEPRPQTATQHGIYPVLAQARLTFGWTAAPTGAVTGAGEQEYKLILYIAPVFVLANPYNTPIKADFYRVRIDLNDATSGSGMRFLSAYIGSSSTHLWRSGLSEFFEGQDYRLNCRTDLAPGEARIFTLVNDGVPYAAEKTYQLEDDWSEFAIRVDTGATFGESVLYVKNGSPTLTGKGLHFFFSGTTNPPAWQVDGWTGPMAQSIPYGTSNGGTLSWTLLNDNQEQPSVYQRLETFGYNAIRMSERGVRGSGSPAVPPYNGGGFTAPDPNSPRFFSSLITRMADAGIYTGTNNNFNSSYISPYYSQFNWRAPLVSRTAYYNSKDSQGPSVVWRMGVKDKGNVFNFWLRPFTGDTRRVYWNGVIGEVNDQPLARDDWQPFDIPHAATGVVSLGQLQHFNAGGHNDGYTFPERKSPLSSGIPTPTKWAARYIAPTYAIGNSRAHPNVPATALNINRGSSTQPFYDLSHLLNRQLFDGYFLSTYPQTGDVDLATDRLPNPRIQPFRGSLTVEESAFRGGTSAPASDVFLAARNLLVTGAFNVNSTSVEAWTALLSSLRDTELNDDSGLEGPFPRSINQPGGTAGADNGQSVNAWNGFRNLTSTQINALASAIVAEVKDRGVSLSLSDFINRKLTDNTQGYAGPLQRAIDVANLNTNFPPDITNQYGNTISNLTPSGAPYDYPNHLAKHILEGIAGWLTQADLLQPLAPVLAARSDTFRIRTYGETRNPATNEVNGRAWCEATVQRLPDYVSDAEDAVTPLASLTNTGNQRFGRRFVVVDFRWLSPEDI